MPSPGPRDLLVEIRAASVNPVDYKIRSGGQRALIHYGLPWVLGLDFSGVVTKVGERVTRFAVGDEVYGSPTHRRPGCYAEHLLVDERMAARKPKNLTHHEAASIPLVGLTAWGAVVVQGRLQAGQKAFIMAGSGGVGSFAIQLAKDLGAYVATTCSARNVDLVRSLGADEVIDYNETKFEDVLKDYDFVLDAIGGETRDAALGVMKRGGQLATMISGFPAAAHKYGAVRGPFVAVAGIVSLVTRAKLLHGVTVHMVLRDSDGRLLDPITSRIEAGTIRPVIDRVYPLEQIVEAHTYLETGRARGKIIIDPTVREAPSSEEEE